MKEGKREQVDFPWLGSASGPAGWMGEGMDEVAPVWTSFRHRQCDFIWVQEVVLWVCSNEPVFLKTMSQGPDILSNAAIFVPTAFWPWSPQLSVVVLTVPIRRKKSNITLFTLNQLKPSSQIYNWEFSIGGCRGLLQATGCIESYCVDSIKSPGQVRLLSSSWEIPFSTLPEQFGYNSLAGVNLCLGARECSRKLEVLL